jgi:hypothetical protein
MLCLIAKPQRLGVKIKINDNTSDEHRVAATTKDVVNSNELKIISGEDIHKKLLYNLIVLFYFSSHFLISSSKKLLKFWGGK